MCSVNAALLALTIDAAIKAGDAMRGYCGPGDSFKVKNDGSPLTLANMGPLPPTVFCKQVLARKNSTSELST
jgi:hypothetical protein